MSSPLSGSQRAWIHDTRVCILQRNELVDAVLGGHEKMRGAKPTDLAVAANLEGAGDNERQVIIGVRGTSCGRQL